MTIEQVREIGQAINDGVLYGDLAEIFGVAESTVEHIARGHTWSGVSGVERRNRRVVWDDDHRREILRLRSQGLCGAEIARRVGCSESTVSRTIAHAKAASMHTPPP